MPGPAYQPLPTSSPPPSPPSRRSPTNRPLRQSVEDEFNRPPPSWFKRLLLVLGLVGMVWLTIKLGSWGRGPQVVYASRYSDEFKYRPAASPVITEQLKDGRIRIRGATLGGVGVREEDIPKSPAQVEAEMEKRLKEAREAAKRQLGLKKRKKKGGVKTEV